MIFVSRDAKCILFVPFGKAYRPKNAIFAAYLSKQDRWFILHIQTTISG